MNDKKMDENFPQAVLDFAEKLKSSSGRNLFVNNFYEAAHDNGVRERYAGSWLSAGRLHQRLERLNGNNLLPPAPALARGFAPLHVLPHRHCRQV
jgi:hypothetical protein